MSSNRQPSPTIAVDAMGGDRAPEDPVAGAWLAANEDGARILLVGDRERVTGELARHGASDGIEIVHAEEVVGMAEPASTPLRRKKRSSLAVCARLVHEGRAEGMVSAGNTGAAMAVAMFVMGNLPGIDRPALAAVVPNRRGRTVLLDVGANVNAKAHHLRQFAVMGHFYAQVALANPAPRVGLMSVGEEAGKGTEVTRETFRILSTTGLDFIGNVEGRDVYNGEADVVVCDGFVGNVLLKSSEALGRMIADRLREEMAASWRTRLGAALALPALRSLRRTIDPDEYGGAPLLGVAGACFIGHGRSTPHGVRNAIRRAREFCGAGVLGKIRQQVEVLHAQEAKVLAEEAS